MEIDLQKIKRGITTVATLATFSTFADKPVTAQDSGITPPTGDTVPTIVFEPTPQEIAQAIEPTATPTGTINIRDFAGAESTDIGDLTASDMLHVTGSYLNENNETWYRVIVDGQEQYVGWVKSDLVQFTTGSPDDITRYTQEFIDRFQNIPVENTEGRSLLTTNINLNELDSYLTLLNLSPDFYSQAHLVASVVGPDVLLTVTADVTNPDEIGNEHGSVIAVRLGDNPRVGLFAPRQLNAFTELPGQEVDPSTLWFIPNTQDGSNLFLTDGQNVHAVFNWEKAYDLLIDGIPSEDALLESTVRLEQPVPQDQMTLTLTYPSGEPVINGPTGPIPIAQDGQIYVLRQNEMPEALPPLDAATYTYMNGDQITFPNGGQPSFVTITRGTETMQVQIERRDAGEPFGVTEESIDHQNTRYPYIVLDTVFLSTEDLGDYFIFTATIPKADGSAITISSQKRKDASINYGSISASAMTGNDVFRYLQSLSMGHELKIFALPEPTATTFGVSEPTATDPRTVLDLYNNSSDSSGQIRYSNITGAINIGSVTSLQQ